MANTSPVSPAPLTRHRTSYGPYGPRTRMPWSRRWGRPPIWPGATKHLRDAARKRAERAAQRVIRLAWVEAIQIDVKRTKSLKRKAWHKRRDKELAAERAERERLANLPSAKFWCGAQLPDKEALDFVKQNVLPAQPEAARKYIAQVAQECAKAGLNVNRCTLVRGGVAAGVLQRRLTWHAEACGQPWKQAVELAAKQTAASVPKSTLDHLFAERAASLGTGARIAAEMDKTAL